MFYNKVKEFHNVVTTTIFVKFVPDCGSRVAKPRPEKGYSKFYGDYSSVLSACLSTLAVWPS